MVRRMHPLYGQDILSGTYGWGILNWKWAGHRVATTDYKCTYDGSSEEAGPLVDHVPPVPELVHVQPDVGLHLLPPLQIAAQLAWEEGEK